MSRTPDTFVGLLRQLSKRIARLERRPTWPMAYWEREPAKDGKDNYYWPEDIFDEPPVVMVRLEGNGSANVLSVTETHVRIEINNTDAASMLHWFAIDAAS